MKTQTWLTSLKVFLKEYRGTCADTWGSAMEAWFEATGQMNKRGLPIPEQWEYRPGLGSDGTDEESLWYDNFEGASDEMITEIAHFMFRYCRLLKHFNKDY